MCPEPGDSAPPRWPDRRAGFALIGAIFVLLILGLVGSAMLRLSSMQQTTVSHGIMGARAYHAARSGVEWALRESTATPGSCPATTLVLSEGGIAGFAVDVGCARSTHTEGAVTADVLRITANASYGSFGDPDYVSRRLSATIRPPP